MYEDVETMLERTTPASDYIGSIAEEARRERTTAYKYICILLAVCLVVSTGMNLALAKRPIQDRWIRIGDMGVATPIQYSDLHYTPQVGEARNYLSTWAKLRFARLRSTLATNRRKSYYFIDNQFASSLMANSSERKEVLDVEQGTGQESDVDVSNVIFHSFGRHNVAGTILMGGEATIDMERTYVSSGAEASHKEHWLVAVTFYMNPEAVSDLSRQNPDYGFVNPLGLCITQYILQRGSE